MSDWTPERIDKLKELAAAGLSASQIAKRLCGVTRSAVLGKLYRMGIPSNTRQNGDHAQGKKPRRNAVSKRKSEGAAQRMEPAVAQVNDDDGLPIAAFDDDARAVMARMEAEARARRAAGDAIHVFDIAHDQCRYVLGEPEDLLMCGRAVWPGTTMCPGHMRRCCGVFLRRKRPVHAAPNVTQRNPVLAK